LSFIFITFLINHYLLFLITINVGSSASTSTNSDSNNDNVDADMSCGDVTKAINMEVDQVQQPIGGEVQSMVIGGK